MLLVDHHVRLSPIHGLGVFVRQKVKAGAVVWRYEPMFDVEIASAIVATFPPEEAKAVYHHAEYLPERGIFRLGNDADIFMNHSDRPTLTDCGDEMVALRDLNEGDELTCDYRQVCVLGYSAETELPHLRAA